MNGCAVFGRLVQVVELMKPHQVKRIYELTAARVGVVVAI